MLSFFKKGEFLLYNFVLTKLASFASILLVYKFLNFLKMSTLTKKEINFWIRISLLAFIIHTLVLSLVYNDFGIFLPQKQDFLLLRNITKYFYGISWTISYRKYFPRIIDSFTIPLFYYLYLILNKYLKKEKEKEKFREYWEFSILAAFLGIVFIYLLGWIVGLTEILSLILIFNFFLYKKEKNLKRNIFYKLLPGFILGMVVGLSLSLFTSVGLFLSVFLGFCFTFLFIVSKELTFFSLKMSGRFILWFKKVIKRKKSL